MTIDYVSRIEGDAEQLVSILRAFDLTRPVSSCPGWTLEELGRHVAGVHRWAADLASGTQESTSEALADEAVETAELVAMNADRLVAALRALPHDRECQTLYPPGRVGTWARRQALETSVHLWDAADATGASHGIDPELARDGVAEVVNDLYPRQVRLGRAAPVTHAVRFEFDEGSQVVLGSETEHAVAWTVRGPAADILLLLWGLRSVGDEVLCIDGEASALQVLLRSSITP